MNKNSLSILYFGYEAGYQNTNAIDCNPRRNKSYLAC